MEVAAILEQFKDIIEKERLAHNWESLPTAKDVYKRPESVSDRYRSYGNYRRSNE